MTNTCLASDVRAMCKVTVVSGCEWKIFLNHTNKALFCLVSDHIVTNIGPNMGGGVRQMPFNICSKKSFCLVS